MDSPPEPRADATSRFSIQTDCVRHLLLLRHGETDWNAEWRIQSNSDISINDAGRRQVAWAAERIVEATRARAGGTVEVWSSPVQRAAESASIVHDALCADARDPGAVQRHPGLAEFDMGEFTGRTLDELRSDPRWDAYVQAPDRASFPGGESMVDIWRRVETGLCELVARSTARTLVVVSHGGVIRALVTSMLGMPRDHFHRLRIGNGSLCHVRLAPPDRIRVLSVNHTAELTPLR